jgi:hypothetical protein
MDGAMTDAHTLRLFAVELTHAVHASALRRLASLPSEVARAPYLAIAADSRAKLRALTDRASADRARTLHHAAVREEMGL